MNLHLAPLTREHVQLCRIWRNGNRVALRTPILLTDTMQDDWFDKVAGDRLSTDRYWEVVDDVFLGIVGLTSTQWENRIAEVSLFIDPSKHGKGYGRAAVGLICEEGFDRMNLHTIFGEAYLCNPAYLFWEKITKEMGGYLTRLPDRKYYSDSYHWSVYFSWSRENWYEYVRNQR